MRTIESLHAQICTIAVAGNFFTIFAEALLGAVYSTTTRGLLLAVSCCVVVVCGCMHMRAITRGMSRIVTVTTLRRHTVCSHTCCRQLSEVLPSLIVIGLGGQVATHGAHAVIRALFVVKVTLAVAMLAQVSVCLPVL